MTAAIIQPYAAEFGRPVDEVTADLESYVILLRKWQAIQNLVSRETLDAIWTRHFADSLQVLRFVRNTDHHFLDLGSGGGFPALPLAIASKGTSRKFTLVEPTSRKVSFLRTVGRDLALSVDVRGTRIEQIDSRETMEVDVITSRALASLEQLLAWMARFFRPQTRALLHKGREHVEEIELARASWDFDVLIHRSDTDPGGVILEISNLRGKSMR